jgi:hypothetical protein
MSIAIRAASAGLAVTLFLAVQIGERALYGESRPHRPLGIVFLRRRVAE